VEGTKLIPDLAADLPEVSPDGLTYTFHLKDGARFGPPVSREIVARDIAYAFERIGTPSLVAQYGFYYGVIEGMAEFQAGEAEAISGIETPTTRRSSSGSPNRPATSHIGSRCLRPARSRARSRPASRRPASAAAT
jgi:ABC-type transport system substrate-binding protein